ncbi:hypothetical protein CRENBAI_018253 [Crenichthys baileyi]|uniref:WWE domain-containing protein n=1 Tax=Crenichthys baileyi TaxID=28760 RepID=A0AAV9SBG4_9TELE
MARPGSGLLVPMNRVGYPPQNLARVVVWEWLNEHGRWRPYSAAVCHHIENVLKGDARGSVVLGQVDAQLSPYIIDLQSMHQFRQDTGLEILELAGNAAHDKKNTRTITCSWLSTTIRTSTSCWVESPSLSCSPMKLMVNSPTTVLLRATHL